MEKVTLIKVGGHVIDEEVVLRSVLQDFSMLPGYKILIHGGGKIATSIGEQLGIKAKMEGGRRITDAGTLLVVTMVYGGLVNKKIVALLQSFGCNAVGFTGADGNIIPAHKRANNTVDYGYVGDFDPANINVKMLKKLLEAGVVPVIAPLTHDGQGNLLNTNADTIAAGLSIALSSQFETHLVYCFDKKGVLVDVEDPSSVISYMDKEKYEECKNANIIADGMLPKLENAFQSMNMGVSSVRICHASDLTSEKCGTTLYL